MANSPILLLRHTQHPHSLTLLTSSRWGIKRRIDASNRMLFEHCVRNYHTTRVDPHHNVGLTRSDLVTKQIICIKTRQTYAEPFVASVGTSVCMTVQCQNYEDLEKDIRMDAISRSSQLHVIGAHYIEPSRRKHACAATPLRMVTGNTIFGVSKNSSTPAASQFIKEEIRLEICGTSTRSSCEQKHLRKTLLWEILATMHYANMVDPLFCTCYRGVNLTNSTLSTKICGTGGKN